MWIIRNHKLETRDYNYSKRALERMGFIARKTPSITFVKALFFHILQKKSWRATGNLLHTNHLSLYHFYQKYKKHPKLREIFHSFADRGIIVYTNEKRDFSLSELLNSETHLALTKAEIDAIFDTIIF